MQTDHQILWGECLKIIKDNLDLKVFETWFEPIIPVSYKDGIVTIEVPTPFFQEMLELRYLDLLKKALYRVYGERTQLAYKIRVAEDG